MYPPNKSKQAYWVLYSPGAATIFRWNLSESLGILKVGVPGNSCNINMTLTPDKKAALHIEPSTLRYFKS